MYPNTVIILLLPLALWAKVEGGAIFDNLDACDATLEAKITETDRDSFPVDVKDKMAAHFPWIVRFTNYKDEKVVGTKFLNNKIEIKLKGNGQEKTTESINVDWNKLLDRGESGGIKLQVWSFNEDTLVFTYYLCKPNGGKTGGAANPRFGIAVAYGNRAGGIPDEALYDLQEVKNHIKEKFGVTADLKEYDMDMVV